MLKSVKMNKMSEFRHIGGQAGFFLRIPVGTGLED